VCCRSTRNGRRRWSAPPRARRRQPAQAATFARAPCGQPIVGRRPDFLAGEAADANKHDEARKALDKALA